MWKAVFQFFAAMLVLYQVGDALVHAQSESLACSAQAEAIGMRDPQRYAAALVCCAGNDNANMEAAAKKGMSTMDKAAYLGIVGPHIGEIARARATLGQACTEAGFTAAER